MEKDASFHGPGVVRHFFAGDTDNWIMSTSQTLTNWWGHCKKVSITQCMLVLV